jgi:metal-dependent hydrolase (beta-lactamase superfamily II)
MLNFKSYYSGSSGNLYTVDDGRTKILIEAGVSVKKIKEALGFKLSEISFALLSHSHGDHSKAAKDIGRNGIPLYTSRGTIDALKLSGHLIISYYKLRRGAPFFCY